MTRTVAIEGLPGAGKTTLVESLHRTCREVTAFEELLVPSPANPSREFFVINDLVRAERCADHERVMMDRFWASTVAYVLAETRLSGEATTVQQVIGHLYGHPPASPNACVFLDSSKAVREVNATDGLFPDRHFRTLLREAYLDIFASLAIPTLVVRNGRGDVATFVTHHLYPR